MLVNELDGKVDGQAGSNGSGGGGLHVVVVAVGEGGVTTSSGPSDQDPLEEHQVLSDPRLRSEYIRVHACMHGCRPPSCIVRMHARMHAFMHACMHARTHARAI